jgi:hypothetical protein
MINEAAENTVQTIAMEDPGNEDLLKETTDVHKTKFKAEPEVRLAGMEAEAIDENDEAFIGPRLPRRMTKEEIEDFKKELFAKYFPT